ncbi:S8 family serine peptidase [Nocardia bovistercoris]|uniref:S8 family serine peptidase n=1 Tax=Nocardia bovistercoris TaxID=2785916 RepID=A0A931IC24_9NOCA|nr:S8 family serine peptidase [Nocardia bovistercoris]MBH0777796.1 S8 family serine peptidase [Nocardia bovistercoris]
MGPTDQRRSSLSAVSGTRPAPAELIVVTHGAAVPLAASTLRESVAAEARLTGLLPPGARLTRIFGPADRLSDKLAATAQESVAGRFLNYFTVRDAGFDLETLAHRLREDDLVDGAYVKPATELPIAPLPMPRRSLAPVPSVTPDFRARQSYLDPAPHGIDARRAWTQPGGRGAGVRVIDIEGAWRFTHEGLTGKRGGILGGEPRGDEDWRNHGTAVAGVIGGGVGGFGITGIAPDATVSAMSIFGGGSALAIRSAADALGPGDVILLELHRPGPRHDFRNRADQAGYLPVEWWPDDLAAIGYAVARGVVVVEAAGNGGEDLDAALYDLAPADFPSTWRNPLRGGDHDSGAILVGAGAPPPGVHDRDHGPALSRLAFSNHGARLDAQGWGLEVTTTGYGDLQGGGDEDYWYTDVFSGTSGAAPIVVGAIVCGQGIAAHGAGPRTPAEVRALLRATGSPQVSAPGSPAGRRIGNLPDIRALAGE